MWRTAGCRETWRLGGGLLSDTGAHLGRGQAVGAAGTPRDGDPTGPILATGRGPRGGAPGRAILGPTMPPARPPSAAPVRPRSRARGPRRAAPVLARQVRGEIVESVHRGHIVRGGRGRPRDPRRRRRRDGWWRCAPASSHSRLVALAEAGGFRDFGLTPAEIALMASSHSGEDLHVRTLQARLPAGRRSARRCSPAGPRAPRWTRSRRPGWRATARGPAPSATCAPGYHAAMLLLARLARLDASRTTGTSGIPPRSRCARRWPAPSRPPRSGSGRRSTTAACETYAFPLAALARAYAFLADPEAVPADDPRGGARRRRCARSATRWLRHPEMVGGTRERLDTSLMKALPGRLVVKGGAEGLRGVAVLPDPARRIGASAVAVKVEDGGGFDRATWAVSVEASRLAGVLEGQALRLARPLPSARRAGPARPDRGRDDRRLRPRPGGRARRLKVRHRPRGQAEAGARPKEWGRAPVMPADGIGAGT